MRKLRRFTSRLAPFARPNVDTDQIIPAAYLKVTDKGNLGRGLFANWRYRDDGQPLPEFVLNRPEYEGAGILVAGGNFGCGSSREHAAWALLDFGFQVVVGTSFADIFEANAAKNGLLAVTLSAADHAGLVALAEATPAAEVTVDLEQRQIETPRNRVFSFEVDPFARYCLLDGIDQLEFILGRLAEIEAYETRHPQNFSTAEPVAARES